MQKTETFHPMAVAEELLQSAEREAREAAQEVEWYKKQKAPKAVVQLAEERHQAATRAVEEARERIRSLERAQEQVRELEKQHAVGAAETARHEAAMAEALLTLMGAYLAGRRAYSQTIGLNDPYRAAWRTLQQREQQLPGLANVVFEHPAENMYKALAGLQRYLDLIQRERIEHEGKPLLEHVRQLVQEHVALGGT